MTPVGVGVVYTHTCTACSTYDKIRATLLYGHIRPTDTAYGQFVIV